MRGDRAWRSLHCSAWCWGWLPVLRGHFRPWFMAGEERTSSLEASSSRTLPESHCLPFTPERAGLYACPASRAWADMCTYGLQRFRTGSEQKGTPQPHTPTGVATDFLRHAVFMLLAGVDGPPVPWAPGMQSETPPFSCPNEAQACSGHASRERENSGFLLSVSSSYFSSFFSKARDEGCPMRSRAGVIPEQRRSHEGPGTTPA